MKISDAKKLITLHLKADNPVFLWGAPGVGKSDAVRQIAADMRDADDKPYPVIDFRAVLRDPVDMRGLPFVDKEARVAEWLPPNDLPQAERDGAEGILFMDELNAASQAVQAACFGLVLDRKVGEYILPPGWRIIAAGNRQSDKAAAQRMPTALANRFAHVDIEPSVDDFAAWANTNNISPEVIAFLRFRPALLHDMATATTQPTFPTPRAWANVAKGMRYKSVLNDKAMRFQWVKSLVGEGAAVEFNGFVEIYQNLPSIDQILMAPKQAPVPTEAAARYAVASALARKLTGGNFDKAIIYMERVSKEFEVMMVLDACKQQEKRAKAQGKANANNKGDKGDKSEVPVAHTEAFNKWAIKHASFFGEDN